MIYRMGAKVSCCTISKRFSKESSHEQTKVNLFKEYSAQQFDNALELNAFTWISDHLLTFAPFFEEENTLGEFCVNLLSEMCISVIQNLAWILELIQKNQIGAIRHQIALPSQRYFQATEKFIKLLSSVYDAKPQFAHSFLSSCYDFVTKDIPQFFQSMSVPSEGIHALSFVSYVQLLSSISKTYRDYAESGDYRQA